MANALDDIKCHILATNKITMYLYDVEHVLSNGGMTLPLQDQGHSMRVTEIEQDAQLLQRDRAAGCVMVFELERGDNILRTL